MAEDNLIELIFLDHVAIRVSDISRSINWYEEVLGLKTYKLPEWGEFPVFMLSGKSGIALFPAKQNNTQFDKNEHPIQIDHFAFNVTNENFEKAKQRYKNLNLEFSIQDHFYFHSIYTNDPDGHTVELTTLVVNDDEFYKSV
ncbi:VOC family protein [Psychroserpens algicola]|uniref:VOC family protein n=1 Tax=Psychroserpens algicola TaxID=1719034 RepID=UPI0019541706|nr:VOC family protein [Psychroserpens algicola]